MAKSTSKSLRIALALSALLVTQAASAQVPPAPTSPAPPTKLQAESPAQAAPTPAHELTAEDLGSWFDGLMPWALARGGIAGAVVTVVKDGQVLFARGYGYADVEKRKPVDPNETLFRIGSTSKLFTWTAVMQQVEQGKLDLDKDVNSYLDFKIPDAFGKPITLRNVMTHTAGFEEQLKDILPATSDGLQPLGEFLRTHIPARVYPPGEIIAYSNYATALAGYIVERVSGQKYDDYIEQHIYAPLGMTKASFRQPLPAPLAPNMSNGYRQASQPAQPFEFVGPFPAGSMAATGTDMAKFMAAHLNQGAPLLKPETAAKMYELNKAPVKGLDGMRLGFLGYDQNGRRIVGHGGDTQLFHTEMALLLDEKVGLFISFNSAGTGGVTGPLRTAVRRGFVDRYFPRMSPLPDEPTLPTAREHGEKIAGAWHGSRGGVASWMHFAGALSPAKAVVNPDNTISISSVVDASGAPKKWREVQPFIWREVNGTSRIAVQLDAQGQPSVLGCEDFIGTQVLLRSGFAMGPTALPLLAASLIVLLVGVLAWPAMALVRRRYGRPVRFEGRDRQLYRGSRIAALVVLLFPVLYLLLITRVGGGLQFFTSKIDPLFLVLHLFGLVALLGAVVLLVRAALVWRDGSFGWWGRIANTALALAALVVVWASFAYNLIGFSSIY